VRLAQPLSGLLPALGRLAAATIGYTGAVAAGKPPVQAAQPALGVLERGGVGDVAAVRQHRQMADPNVDTNAGLGPARAGHGPLDLTAKRHDPAATLPRDGGR
jgi:hypothetical protein